MIVGKDITDLVEEGELNPIVKYMLEKQIRMNYIPEGR